MRKVLLALLGVALMVFAYFVANYLIENREKPEAQLQKVVQSVYVDTVQNGSVPVVLRSNGTLRALRRIELYAEVSGVFLNSSHLFKVGQPYRQGEVLLRINDQEFEASVQAQKSDLLNLITSVMPDLRIDYPESYPAWEKYLTDFNLKGVTKSLPDPVSAQEKNFITGRGIYSSFYALKNLESRLSKHIIRAPFNGILTEALVTEGTLIRNGQKLGEFIDPGVYELEVSVDQGYSRYLTIGKEVVVKDLEGNREWTGKVARVNGSVDQGTQTVKAFVQLSDKDLKEGMYLEAFIQARNAPEAVAMDRALLVNQRSVFAVKDTVLELIDVKPVYFSDREVILTGIPNGTPVLSRSVPGAYPGMVVKVVDENAPSTTVDSTNQVNAAAQ